MNNPVKYSVALVLGIAAVGAVAVVALPILGRTLATETSASVQQVVPTVFDSPGTGLSPDPASETWVLQPSSTLGYRVSTTGDEEVTGSTSDLTGVVAVTGDRLTDAEFMVDLSTLVGRGDSRDAVLGALVLATGGNPMASFVLTEPITLPDTPSDNGQTAVESVPIVGTLTMRGISNPVSAEGRLSFDASSGTIQGSIPVDLSAFGMTLPEIGGLTVGDTAYLDVQLDVSPSR